jgi:hypothetical protein
VDRCEQCGFVYDEADAPLAAARIGELAAGIARTLTTTDRSLLATRPAPETWSALEYGCHVRDLLLVQRERVLRMRRELRPAPSAMGREERAEHDGYADQDPTDVARQLTDAAAMFTRALDRMPDADWDRTILYRWPVQQERTMRWVAVHTVHELQHHTGDIAAQLG